MQQSLAYIGAPLATLSREQQAAVAALLVITRAAAEDQLLHQKGGGTLQSLWPKLTEICPPLKAVTLSRGGCVDAEIAYAAAMAGCEKEGKSAAQCDRETAPEMAAAVTCQFKAVEALAGVIRQLPGRAWPPRPFPWPTTDSLYVRRVR